MAKGVIDIALVYSFLKRLVTPFKDWEAYKAGVIDDEGKVIITKDKRTPEQDRSWGYFDRLVANLKKLLGKVPGGKTRLATFAAALLLIKENNLDPDDMDYLEECLEHYMEDARMIQETTNAVGTGAYAGLGVGDQGEPPGKPRKTKCVTRHYIEINGKRKRRECSQTSK